MAVKFEEVSKRKFGSNIDKESLYLRNLYEAGVRCIPRYYGNGFHRSN